MKVNREDEQSGQGKYSTEIVIQVLTMLGGEILENIANDKSQSISNIDDNSQISNDMDDEIPFS